MNFRTFFVMIIVVVITVAAGLFFRGLPLTFFLNGSPVTHDLTQSVNMYLTKSTPLGMFEKINQYRTNVNLPVFKQDPDVCVATPSTGEVCQNCSHSALVSISKYATTNQLLLRLLEEPAIKATIEDRLLQQLCVSDTGDTLSLLFTRRANAIVRTNATIVTQQIPVRPTPVPTNFTEDQLWTALVIYRQAHKVSDLAHDDKLCAYARKRVADQIAMMAVTKPADYPNPDKYPLDAHQGFSKDAQSGYAFDVTSTTRLAENLAYYPNAQNATQIIEWGWDTSTEGHRETQLSNDWTKACIAGGSGFYSAIFGS